MFRQLENSLNERLNFNNFFIGIFFILLCYLLVNIVNSKDLESFTNSLQITLKFLTSNDMLINISIFQSIALVFIIGLIGYIIDFSLKAIYHINIACILFFKKYTHKNECNNINTNNSITPSQKLKTIALNYNETFLDIKVDNNLKDSMTELYLTLIMKRTNESLYKHFIHRLKKLKFYQNIISLFYFFISYSFCLKFLSYFITSGSFLIIFLYSIITMFLSFLSVHIAYKQFQEYIDSELLVFIEAMHTKCEKYE